MHTVVLITSNVEEQNNLGNVMLISTGLVLLVVFTIIGVVLSFKNPGQFSFSGTFMVGVVIIFIAGLMFIVNKVSSRSFYKNDLNKILSILS